MIFPNAGGHPLGSMVLVTPGLPTFGLSRRSLTDGPTRNSSVNMRSAEGVFAPWQKSFWQRCTDVRTQEMMPGTAPVPAPAEHGGRLEPSVGPPSPAGGGGVGPLPLQAEPHTSEDKTKPRKIERVEVEVEITTREAFG